MAKNKARTVLVRLVSTAKTGFFYQCQRPRLSEKLSAIKYDPKVKQHVLFLEGKR